MTSDMPFCIAASTMAGAVAGVSDRSPSAPPATTTGMPGPAPGTRRKRHTPTGSNATNGMPAAKMRSASNVAV